MTSLEDLLFSNLWPGLLAWTAIYVSDYSMTLVCARLYQHCVRERISFEGSFELNPHFQADIDSLRIVSPKVVTAMLISCVYLSAVWWLARQTQVQLYEFVLGAFLSMELAIHIRHVRNFFLFRAISKGNSVQGHIHYARPLLLRLSSVEFFAFSGMFAVLSVFTSSWFLFGGAVTCLGVALKNTKLAKSHSAYAQTAAAPIQTVLKPPSPDPISR